MKQIVLAFLVLASLHLSAQQTLPTYIPTNGLVGWWPFTGNANDSSGNGNHGVLHHYGVEKLPSAHGSNAWILL
jgi:hypothetical protein